MASRGNSSSGGGCLGAGIVFFILFFLPAWVTGDSFGWGVLIVWWIILAVICFCIYAANSPSSNSSTYSTVSRSPSNSSINTAQKTNTSVVEKGTLMVSAAQLNKSITEGYYSKIQLKTKLRNTIEEIRREQQNIEEKIKTAEKEKTCLLEGQGKPIFTTKKRWLLQKQPEINSLENEKTSLEEKRRENECRISQIEKEIDEVIFNVFDESNTAFEKLKVAFDKVKKSCNVSGTPNLINSSVPNNQRDKDLHIVRYKIAPYGLLLDNYRIYIFPNGIWVFEGDAKLVGVYKPKALQGSFETKENIKQSYYSSYSKKPEIYEDTKIITKDIPHHTWLHTCRDGSPDLRYSYNPRQTYYTKQEYYIECSFDLDICGCKLKYAISSFDNCEILEKAIRGYAQIKENKDMIPILLDLLRRCTDGQDVKIIQEKIAIH